MTIREYGSQIQQIVSAITCYAPEWTVLGIAGGAVVDMVRAYSEDGTLFLRQGDPVNAIASFGYAQGWLEGGKYLGLVSTPSPGAWTDLDAILDPSVLSRLQEKVHRYHRLLAEGISAVEPAPDTASYLWRGAGEILKQAESALRQGEQQNSAGKLPEALRWFGYGHGWLDVGARMGLFRITGRRELFTL